VLEIVLAKHPVARTLRVARELQVALVNVRGGAAKLGVRTIGLKLAVWVMVPALIVVMEVATTAARLTATAPLTLHWKFTIVL